MPHARPVVIAYTAAVRIADYLRTIGHPILDWWRRPASVPSWARNERLQVMATAALTSALVSALTLWTWGEGQVVSGSEVGAVTVSYELLGADAGAAGSADAAGSFEAGETTRPDDAPARVRQDGDVLPVTAGSADVDRPSRLVVITQPSGARVTINGVGWGTTPVTIPYPPAGTKRIRVTKSGYESEERVVDADGASAGSTLRIQLREAARTRTRR